MRWTTGLVGNWRETTLTRPMDGKKIVTAILVNMYDVTTSSVTVTVVLMQFAKFSH